MNQRGSRDGVEKQKSKGVIPMNNENLNKTPGDATTAEHTRNGLYFRPNVDIQEQQDELRIVADLPGAKSDSIDLNFEDGALTIHATVAQRHDPDRRYLLHEYGVGDYYRTFQIAETIDSSKITAEYADGVLTLHLPKTEAVKPRKIQVLSN
jgi:HSP20 family protein